MRTMFEKKKVWITTVLVSRLNIQIMSLSLALLRIIGIGQVCFKCLSHKHTDTWSKMKKNKPVDVQTYYWENFVLGMSTWSSAKNLHQIDVSIKALFIESYTIFCYRLVLALSQRRISHKVFHLTQTCVEVKQAYFPIQIVFWVWINKKTARFLLVCKRKYLIVYYIFFYWIDDEGHFVVKHIEQ